MSDFKVGEQVEFKYCSSNKKGLITGVKPESKSPYKYWVEWETEEGSEGEFFSDEELTRIDTSYDQTVMFWYLQLQFMEMEFNDLLSVYVSIKCSPTYVVNKHTSKINDIMDDYARSLYSSAKVSFDDKIPCLATHLALQLSGIEE